MSKTGLARPGAMQMVGAAILVLVVAIGPLFLAAVQPEQVWSIMLTGFPAFAVSVSGLLVLVLYLVGFLRYCASKGYSKWLGFWLLLGHFAGFIALLLLPDLKTGATEQVQT